MSSACTVTNLDNIDTHYETVNITMGAAILVLTSLNRNSLNKELLRWRDHFPDRNSDP